MIYIIEDNELMAECIADACKGHELKIFHEAVSAISEMSDENPDLIFLDVLLTGPDGFTFLNEIMSYEDSSKIPIVIVSSLDLSRLNLKSYGVVEVLNKDTMLPKDIKRLAGQYAK